MTDAASMPAMLQQYDTLKTANPKLRARDAAEALGAGEGQLVEARAAREGFRQLAPRGSDLFAILERLRNVGPVMSLVRNDAAVQELTGPMGPSERHGAMGQVTGAIDLRLFMRSWHVGFLVEEEVASGRRRSIQIFDRAGDAVIKLYATAETDAEAFLAISTDLEDPAPEPVDWAAKAPAAPDRPDAEIDVDGLREAWRGIEHSHDFFGVLKRFGVGRQQALRLGGGELARPLRQDAITALLTRAAESGVPIMCFVGNPGALQIYSGPVVKIAPMGPWINVLDPGFNLHLRTDKVAHAWCVTKPTLLRGEITSIELFDGAGEMIAQLFGARPPGEGENPAWRSLAHGLEPAA